MGEQYQMPLRRGKKKVPHGFAIPGTVIHTSYVMHLRGPARRTPGPLRATILALVIPSLALAQFNIDPRNVRNRGDSSGPQKSQKVDEATRKLRDPDPDKRLEGVKDMAELEGEAKIVDPLLSAANDADQRVRLKAIDTLGALKINDATPFLVQQLFLRDVDSVTKRHVMVALGKIGDHRATGPLLDVANRDHDPAIRGNAIFALGDIGDPAAVAPLETLEKSTGDTELQRVAAASVRKIKDRPPPEVLPPALAGERRRQEALKQQQSR